MDRAEIEKVSKALADGTRLIIFEALAKRKRLNCSEIVFLQGVTPATVSHHLKVLADAGLIKCPREGQFIYNQAVPSRMKEYARSLSEPGSGEVELRGPLTNPNIVARGKGAFGRRAFSTMIATLRFVFSREPHRGPTRPSVPVMPGPFRPMMDVGPIRRT